MFKSDNNLCVLIGLDIARTANVQVNDRGNATTYIADGEIVVLGSDDAVLPAGSTYADSKNIKIVQRSGATTSTSELLRTMVINGANVTSYTGQSYQAPQEQIYYVGYDGITATNNIDYQDSNDYTLRIRYKHDKEIWSQQTNERSYYYTSGTSATAEIIARSLAIDICADSAADVTCERLTSHAGTAGVITATVVNGSNMITMSAVSALFVAGVYIRIGTAVTDPVYRITAKDSTGLILTIDTAYQGTSGTALATEYITAAEASATTTMWGLKLTGEALTFDVGKFKYNKVMFDLSLGGFGATTTNELQESSRGNGTYEQVAELEWYAQGFEGKIDRDFDTSPTIRADATVAETYDTIAINYYDTSVQSNIISGVKPMRGECKIFIPDGASQATNILAQLNPWMASLPQAYNNISL